MTPTRVPLKLTRTLQWRVVKVRPVRNRYDKDVRAGKRPEDPDGLQAEMVPDPTLIHDQYRQALRAKPEPAWSVNNADGRESIWRRSDVCRQLSRPRINGLLNPVAPPSLWLHGIDDPLMPGVSAQYLPRLLPTWQADAVADAGHLPHLERVDWTVESIDAWLDRAPHNLRRLRER